MQRLGKIIALTTTALATVLAQSTLANPDFRLINNDITATLTHVYLSQAGRNNYTEDILGSHVVEPGESTFVDFHTHDEQHECYWDIKVVYRGSSKVYRNRDLCSISRMNVDSSAMMTASEPSR